MMALALVRVNDGVLANEGDKIWLAALDDSATGSSVRRLKIVGFQNLNLRSVDWSPRLRFAVAALRGKAGKFHDPTFVESPHQYQKRPAIAVTRTNFQRRARVERVGDDLRENRFSSGTATFDIGYVDIYIVNTYVVESLRP